MDMFTFTFTYYVVPELDKSKADPCA